eukprot:Awhi_evm1s7186
MFIFLYVIVLENKLGVDVLIVPTTISGAPSIEEWNKSSEVDHYANDVFTVPASLAGSSPFFSILS